MTYQDLLNELKEKEKGCGKEYTLSSKILCGEIRVTESYMATRLTKNTKKYYCKTCQAEISALKKGIQACEERDKEINNAIDFLSSYPIWTKIYHEEDKDTEEIPDELYPILDNFVKMIQKILKQQLTNQSQQNKIGSGALEVPQVVSTLKSENKIYPSADTQTHTDTDKPIILDDNPLSIACYMQEHPEFVKELDTCKKAMKE